MAKLTILEVSSQTMEILQNNKRQILSLLQGGKTSEEIVEALKLKVTPDVLQAYIEEYNVLSALCYSSDVINEIAYLLNINLSDAEMIASNFDELVQKLKAQKKSYAQIASETLMDEEDIKQYFKNSKKREDITKIVMCFCSEWLMCQITEEVKMDEEEVEDIIKQFESKALDYSSNGKTIEEIASILNFAPQCILFVLSKEEEIYKNQKAVSMQTFAKENKAGHKDRLKRLSSLRDCLMKEINERGLQDVPIDKLIALYLKTEDAIRCEMNSTSQTAFIKEATHFNSTELSLRE